VKPQKRHEKKWMKEECQLEWRSMEMRNLKPKKVFHVLKKVQLTMTISVWHFSIFLACFVSFSIWNFFYFLERVHVCMLPFSIFIPHRSSVPQLWRWKRNEEQMYNTCITSQHKSCCQLTNDIAIIISDLKEQEVLVQNWNKNVKIRLFDFEFSFMFLHLHILYSV
jgi:hypothetical protein